MNDLRVMVEVCDVAVLNRQTLPEAENNNKKTPFLVWRLKDSRSYAGFVIWLFKKIVIV